MGAPGDIRRLNRGCSPCLMLEALVDNGAMTRDEIRPLFKNENAFRKQMSTFKNLGLIKEVVVITAGGRIVLDEFEITAPTRSKPKA